MPTELSVHASHQGGMRVLAQARAHTIPTDYPLRPDQETVGATSLELLLASLATCGANGVRLLLARRTQGVTGLEVEARAQRRDEHPTVLTAIHLHFRVEGADLEEAQVAQAIEQAERQLCPVWAMLGAGTPIRTSFSLSAPTGR